MNELVQQDGDVSHQLSSWGRRWSADSLLWSRCTSSILCPINSSKAEPQKGSRSATFTFGRDYASKTVP